MKRTIRICSALLLTAVFDLVGAQSYPVKPVRLIFPLLPGSASNGILGRALMQRLSESLGQPVVADYRPGAAGTIGSAAAAKAPPDGYTLLIGYTSSIMISPSLLSSAGFNPVSDLAPIARFAVVPYVAVVHPSLPATNLKALVALAKARPGQINCASGGTGGLPHLAAELFKLTANVDIVHVPYKAAAAAHTDLLGGHVQMQFTGISGMLPSIRAGKLRALAVTATKRSALLPEVPTAAESGFPMLDVTSSLGVLAPANVPLPVVRRLHDEIARIVNGADMKNFIASQGAEPALMDPAEFGAHIKAETAKWARVIKAANVKPD
ncbi:MAG TPA: tripartite tricarboxylate transporter substrate binding protein [Burkholderiales bacterium]|nr:tripartite tricarboxylate transporter substrate binding protein [Burkholderiales bacterium]